jgi:Sodium/calcium exchanger protein
VFQVHSSTHRLEPLGSSFEVPIQLGFELSDSLHRNHTALNRDTDSNKTTSIHDVILYDSAKHELTLEERLEREKLTWHWYPYKRISYHITEAGVVVENLCERELAINDFPHGLFTGECLSSVRQSGSNNLSQFPDEQRLNGAIVLHFAVAFYFFIVLYNICSEYFLPSVECICRAMQIPTDVAAATFMALATTIPEFFTNTISTFVTDSDMGIGTIVGSLLFNTLGVSACAALAAPGVS